MIMRTSLETAGWFSDLLQFPLYATVLAIIERRENRLLVFGLLSLIHTVAVILALTSDSWWR
jgi:hypothetical protein